MLVILRLAWPVVLASLITACATTTPETQCFIVTSVGCLAGTKCIPTETRDGNWLTYDPAHPMCVPPGSGGLFSPCQSSRDCGLGLLCDGAAKYASNRLCMELCDLSQANTCSYGTCQGFTLRNGLGFPDSSHVGTCHVAEDTNQDLKCVAYGASSQTCEACGKWDGDCRWCWAPSAGVGYCTASTRTCDTGFLNKTEPIPTCCSAYTTTCH